MMEAWQSFELSGWQWVLVGACGMMVGMSKVGVQGIYNIVVPVLAIIFGGKPSTGLLLPMLIMADIFAVVYYNREAEWKHVFRLMPWALGGVVIGTVVGEWIPEESFKILISGVILLGIALMLFMEFRKIKSVPDFWWFAGLMGLVSGFATMVGNAAGPIVVIYLLSMRLSKNAFIGTGAWFFLLINLSKLPSHLFVWDTISWESLSLNLLMLPSIGLGAWAGIWIVKQFTDAVYRKFVIVITVLSAVLLLL
jgi:hypothetical protein